MVTRLDSRAEAARAIARVVAGSSLSDVLRNPKIDETSSGRSFVTDMCYGVLRGLHRYQYLAEQLLSKPLSAKEGELLALVWSGFYQLELTRVPDYAAVSATVEAARSLGKPWAAGMMNAVLRRFLREREALLAGAEANPVTQYAHPEWLIRRLRADWPDHWQEILLANNAHAPMWLRVNRRQISRDAYLAMLAAAEIAAVPSAHVADAVRLEQAIDVKRLPGFDQGLVAVQDHSAQLAAELLDVRPGMRVLDACAAPGGKACHILELMPELQELVALDNDADRARRIRENLQRLQLQADIRIADAHDLDAWWDGREFDRILLDAPCSATGVIRRHPDIKILRRESDITALAILQRSILEALWRTLKPGGVLLYATCSTLKQENEHVVGEFLASHGDAKELAIATGLGFACEHGRQLLSGDHGGDGFYYARLEKCVTA